MVYICVVRPNDSIPTIIITFGDGSTQPLTYVLMGWVVEPELSMVELDIRRSISHFGWYIAVLSARWHTNPFTDLYALIGKRETAQLNDLVGPPLQEDIRRSLWRIFLEHLTRRYGFIQEDPSGLPGTCRQGTPTLGDL